MKTTPDIAVNDSYLIGHLGILFLQLNEPENNSTMTVGPLRIYGLGSGAFKNAKLLGIKYIYRLEDSPYPNQNLHIEKLDSPDRFISSEPCSARAATQADPACKPHQRNS
jgi:hypothetical protein